MFSPHTTRKSPVGSFMSFFLYLLVFSPEDSLLTHTSFVYKGASLDSDHGNQAAAKTHWI